MLGTGEGKPFVCFITSFFSEADKNENIHAINNLKK